ARARRPGNREKLAAFDVQVHATQRAHFHLADHVGLDEVPDGDDVGHRRYRPRPPPGKPPPPKLPPRLPGPCWNGLPAAAPALRLAFGRTMPVTSSLPGC